MSETKSFDDLRAKGYQRWYQFGASSPKILVARLRNKYRPVMRLRFAAQRVYRGHDDSMLWSLDYAVANLVVAGVKAMRKWQHGYPGELGSWEEWDKILARIEGGFQAWLDADGWFDKPEEQERFKDGMALFGEWFGGLWD